MDCMLIIPNGIRVPCEPFWLMRRADCTSASLSGSRVPIGMGPWRGQTPNGNRVPCGQNKYVQTHEPLTYVQFPPW